MLEAQDIHKYYQVGKSKLHVLRGVDLKIETGKVTTVQGASGAGKSTLLHLLGALDRPSQGDVIFKGKSLRKAGAGELATLRNQTFGFIFQAFQLLPELDALENVHLPALMARKEDLKRAQKLLHEVGLGQRMDHKALELSGGEQQRVAIARALINDPEIIFADEPTGNLDSENGWQIARLLIDLVRREKKTLIIVTHEADLAQQGDIQLHMKDGCLDKP